MRLLIVSVLVAFTAPTYAADKDEDKAKEVVAAFMKAVIANDLDAVMKTVDVPFMVKVGSDTPVTISKSDELKDLMAKILMQDNSDMKSMEVGKVYDKAGIAKFAKEDEDKYTVEQAEKIKAGYMVMLVEKDSKKVSFTPGLLVRFKDGKAFVVSLSR
jgi:hypothetical protein